MENEIKTQKLSTKEREYVKDKQLEIKKIELKQGSNPQEIEKVYFQLVNGEKISWRPKIEKTQQKKNFNVMTTGKMTFDELPEKLIKMNETINNQGSVKVSANYMIWYKDEKEIKYIPGKYLSLDILEDNTDVTSTSN